MKPTRVQNYYKCHILHYIFVMWSDGEVIDKIIHPFFATTDKEALEELAKKYGIEFVDPNNVKYNEGLYISEDESMVDPDILDMKDVERFFQEVEQYHKNDKQWNAVLDKRIRETTTNEAIKALYERQPAEPIDPNMATDPDICEADTVAAYDTAYRTMCKMATKIGTIIPCIYNDKP